MSYTVGRGTEVPQPGTERPGEKLSLGVAARLSRYLQVLTQARKMGKDTISSQELADYTHVNSTQIRRDLSGFGNPAHPLPPGCNIRIKGVAPGASLAVMNVAGPNPGFFNSTIIQAIDRLVTIDNVKGSPHYGRVYVYYTYFCNDQPCTDGSATIPPFTSAILESHADSVGQPFSAPALVSGPRSYAGAAAGG